MRETQPVSNCSALLCARGPERVRAQNESQFITLIVEAQNELMAREHFECVLCDPHGAGVVELSRALYYVNAQETGRYWRFQARVCREKWSSV